jgi:hypothetical protein
MSPIDRTAWNALVDDDGTNTLGSPWNKAAIKSVVLDPVDAALAAITLVGHGSGHTTNPASENFSGYLGGAGFPLNPYDMLQLEIDLQWSTTVPTAIGLYWAQTNSPLLLNLLTFGNPSIGLSMSRVVLRRHPQNPANLFLIATGGGTGAPGVYTQMIAIDNWAAQWAVVMNHSGIPAGGALDWKWTVTKTTG